MDPKEILKFCMDNGLLIEPEVLDIFSEVTDTESAKLIIGGIKQRTQKRIITKSLFKQNSESVNGFFENLPGQNKEKLEKLKIKLGLQIEISKEVSNSPKSLSPGNENAVFNSGRVKIIHNPSYSTKKLEVNDFVQNFRGRFNEMKDILQERPELENLVSINKLSGNRQSVSIMGFVSEKRVTKNKNILFEVEDLTGRVRVLINQNKKDLYKQAEDISVDSIIGFSGAGDREILFANNLIFPDSRIPERKSSPVEEYAVFISDLQFGSKLFLKGQFDKFISYLSDEGPKTDEVRKIKYLFIVGDLVSGVGVYPGQYKDLEIEDIEEQFKQLAEILKRVRKDIKIIISPGNHDGVRLMEPQPGLDERYAWAIYSLPNVVVTGNPSSINIGSTEDFSGFNVLTYHGYSYPYYANNVPSLIEVDAMNSPEKIMMYLLKNRHLAPSYGSLQYFPSEIDEHLIKKIPDIFVSGHLHKSAITYYNNILVISCSTWESETENQKKRGNKPDFCKVPIFNLKTRAVKVLDFE